MPISHLGHILDANTFALWRMDEASGQLVDASGNGRDLLIFLPGGGFGGSAVDPPAATGLIGGARSFGGGGGAFHQSFTDSAARNVIAGGVTIEGWAKRTFATAHSGYGLFAAIADSVWTPPVFLFAEGYGFPAAAWQNGTPVASGTLIPPVTPFWYHWALRRRSTGGGSWALDCFINAYLTGTTSVPALSAASTSLELTVGGYNYSGDYWQGDLDDIRFSSVARTDDEIAESFTRGMFGYGLGAPASPPIAPPSPVVATPPTLFGGGADAGFGSDILVFPDIDPSLTPVKDGRVIAEAVARRFITPRGTLTFHPDYGLDIRSYLNETVDDALLHRLKAESIAAALQDERVDSAEIAVSYTRATEKLTLRAAVFAATGPFTFTLDVTKLTAVLTVAEG